MGRNRLEGDKFSITFSDREATAWGGLALLNHVGHPSGGFSRLMENRGMNTAMLFPDPNMTTRQLLVTTLRATHQASPDLDALRAWAHHQDPAQQQNPRYCDTPWRFMGLVWNLLGEKLKSEEAFTRAQDWFVSSLEQETCPARRGILVALQVLSTVQANRQATIDPATLQDARHLLDSAAQGHAPDDLKFSRFLYKKYRFFDAIAHRYLKAAQPNDATPAPLWPASSPPIIPIHSAVESAVAALDAISLDTELSIDFADSRALMDCWERLQRFSTDFDAALQPNSWDPGSGPSMRIRILTRYLAAIDSCAPSPTEARDAVTTVAGILADIADASSRQSVQDRAALLLAKSLLRAAHGLTNLDAFCRAFEPMITQCIEAGTLLGMRAEGLTQHLRAAWPKTLFAQAATRKDPAPAELQNTLMVSLFAERLSMHIPVEVESLISTLVHNIPSPIPRDNSTMGRDTRQLGQRLNTLKAEYAQGFVKLDLRITTAIKKRCDVFITEVIAQAFEPPALFTQGRRLVYQAWRIYRITGSPVDQETIRTVLHALAPLPAADHLTLLENWLLPAKRLQSLGQFGLDDVFSTLSVKNDATDTLLFNAMALLWRRIPVQFKTYLCGYLPRGRTGLAAVLDSVFRNPCPQSQAATVAWEAAKRTVAVKDEERAEAWLVALLTGVRTEQVLVDATVAAREQLLSHVNLHLSRQGLGTMVGSAVQCQIKAWGALELARALTEPRQTAGALCQGHHMLHVSDERVAAWLAEYGEAVTQTPQKDHQTLRPVLRTLSLRPALARQLETPGNRLLETMARILINGLSPHLALKIPLGTHYSRTGNPRYAVAHEKAFSTCRALFCAVHVSALGQDRDVLTDFLDQPLQTLDDLLQWLKVIAPRARRSPDGTRLFHEACRACLSELLETERCGIFFHTESIADIQWRERITLSNTMAELLMPELMDQSDEIVAALPIELPNRNATETVLMAAVPVLDAHGTLPRITAALLVRLSGMVLYGDERRSCRAFLQQALQRTHNPQSLIAEMDKGLAETTQATLWMADSDLRSLLCGTDRTEVSDHFTAQLIRQLSVEQVIRDSCYRTITEDVVASVKESRALLQRLSPWMNRVRQAVDLPCEPPYLHALVLFWGRIISVVWKKLNRLDPRETSPEERDALLGFLQLPRFGAHVQLLLSQPARNRASSDGPSFDPALRLWQDNAIGLLPDLATHDGAIPPLGLPVLLAIWEQQYDWAEVDRLIAVFENTLSQHGLDTALALMEVCLKWQDLDGVQRLVAAGIGCARGHDQKVLVDFLSRAFILFCDHDSLLLGCRCVGELRHGGSWSAAQGAAWRSAMQDVAFQLQHRLKKSTHLVNMLDLQLQSGAAYGTL